VWELKKRVIAVQVFLLLIFGVISYVLARNALKPLNESIVKLDKFAKDLIHDLNTPVTSVKLNMKLLQKIPEIQEHKAWERLNRSIHDISELHENLTLLLQEETFQMEIINLCEIIDEVVSVHKQVYPNLQFVVECEDLKVKINKNAMKQILQNIVVNACKYNTKDGYVKIFTKEKKLFIEDSGKGIKEPDKIFERSYSGEHSSGIGLDIVKRLATAMKIDIEVQTSTQGSTFLLQFN
jgi:two-component system OmpR family sensor kinase